MSKKEIGFALPNPLIEFESLIWVVLKEIFVLYNVAMTEKSTQILKIFSHILIEHVPCTGWSETIGKKWRARIFSHPGHFHTFLYLVTLDDKFSQATLFLFCWEKLDFSVNCLIQGRGWNVLVMIMRTVWKCYKCWSRRRNAKLQLIWMSRLKIGCCRCLCLQSHWVV